MLKYKKKQNSGVFQQEQSSVKRHQKSRRPQIGGATIKDRLDAVFHQQNLIIRYFDNVQVTLRMLRLTAVE